MSNENPSTPRQSSDPIRPTVAVPSDIIHLTDIPFIALDASGRIAYANPSAARMLNMRLPLSPDVMLIDHVRTSDQPVLLAHIDRILREKQTSQCEVELWIADCGRLWIKLTGSPGMEADGPSLCWSSMENKTTIRRLEKTEALYQRAAEVVSKAESIRDFGRQLFELLRILFGIQNGHIAMLNPGTGMVEYPAYVNQHDPCPDPHPPGNGMTEYVITMGRLVWLHDSRSGNHVASEGFTIRGTNPSDWLGVPLEFGGRVVGVIAIQCYEPGHVFLAKDVSLLLGVGHLVEVFLQRTQLEEKQQRLSAAIEQAAETVMITDLRGVIQYVNPAFETITGYTREQAIGKTTELIRSGRHPKAYYDQLWATLKEGKMWRGYFVNRKKDGTLYEEEAVISPVRNKTGDVINYVAVKRDMTHEGQLERRYLQAQKSEITSRLMESIRHEFSNILMDLRTQAELLGREAEECQRSRAIPDHIVNVTTRGDALVRSLAKFSAYSPEHPETIDINAVLREFNVLAEKLVGELHSIHYILDPRLRTVNAIPGHIEQVVGNLFITAVDSMPAGGAITVRTYMDMVHADDTSYFPQAHPRASETFAIVEVSDQGVDIDPATYPELFNPEITLRRKSGKPFSGLSIAMEMMKSNHGYISVREQHPQGTIFRLYFPLAIQTSRTPVALTPPVEEQPRGHEVILLAEDDDGARRVMMHMLTEHGYTVLEAESGAMAIRAALGFPKKIDLLLTDMMMPDFDGRALAEQIRGLLPDIRVLYVSGYNQTDLDDASSGARIPLLKKPFRREELLQNVRHILDAPT